MMTFLIFMHIPKTAGSTLRTIIDKQYQEDQILNHPNGIPTFEGLFNELSKEEIRNVKCIKGHYPFGIHQYFSKPFTYITMLRHPIERVLSLYYYIKSESEHPNYHLLKNLSLEEFIDLDADFINSKTERYQLQNNNTQTLYASGGSPLDLKKAKENLRKFFTVVGITEMFDESLSLMQKKLNWNDISYAKALVNKQRPAKEDLSPDILAKIKSKNELDFKLYYWARQNLQEEINNI